MADDVTILDSVGATKTIRTRDKSGKHFQLATTECQTMAAAAAGAVTTTPAKLIASSGGTLTTLSGRRYVRLQNIGPDVMYVGADSGLTTANGFRVGLLGDIELPWGDAVDVWAVSEGTSDARVQQGG